MSDKTGGAAFPLEPVEPFAWAEFDGEGGHDLRLYENNEEYHEEYVRRNGNKYADWVFPLYTAPPLPDAAELWAMAQLVPGEGVEDAVDRIEVKLQEYLK